jgi:hypothetical protein
LQRTIERRLIGVSYGKKGLKNKLSVQIQTGLDGIAFQLAQRLMTPMKLRLPLKSGDEVNEIGG